MGLIEVASERSALKGLDYYERDKVISWKKTGINEYDGEVSGSGGNTYSVHIDTVHPKKSTCSCPFADGRRVVCKHMIALYFTAVPGAADDYMRQLEEWEEEEEEQELEEYEEIYQYVKSLSKEELQEELFRALVELEENDNYHW